MKILLYIAILAAVILVPCKGTDVGKLIPVEVIAISESEGYIKVDTDTGNQGMGLTMQAAFRDLSETAPGVIYLDTAEFIILEEGMEKYINALRGQLKETMYLCHGREGIPLEGIADYLSVHKPNTRLKEVSDFKSIQEIAEEDGQYRIEEK